MKTKLSASKTAGQFKVDAGRPQVRFYLGDEPAEAERRKRLVCQVWAAQRGRAEAWDDDGDLCPHERRPATWDKTSLAIARAVAKGQDVCYLEAPEGMETLWLAGWLAELSRTFPFLTLKLVNEEAYKASVAEREEFADNLTAANKTLVASFRSTTATTFQALAKFAEHIEQTYRQPGTDRLTTRGRSLIRQIDTFKRHWRDIPLAQFGLAEIDKVLNHWRHRPKTLKGTVAAVETCRDHIRLFRSFLKWLHRSEQFPWRKPDDYEIEPVRIAQTRHEIASKVTVPTYKFSEVAVLWQYARPTERLLMALALNFGFGVAEIGTLRQDEINGKTVTRIRHKSGVLGKWCLWDVTRQAIDWYRRHRPASDKPELLVTRRGAPLAEPTAGSNRNQFVANMWAALLNRVRKDHPEFRRLSFNKLRKTSANWVRTVAGGEVACIHLTHGQAVASDTLAEVYTNRTFKPLFRALRRIERKLEKEVFATVSEPFPDKIARPLISLAKIERIRRLRAQGFKIKAIAEAVGVSAKTVQKHLAE